MINCELSPMQKYMKIFDFHTDEYRFYPQMVFFYKKSKKTPIWGYFVLFFFSYLCNVNLSQKSVFEIRVLIMKRKVRKRK